jgi:hypothetical protein
MAELMIAVLYVHRSQIMEYQEDIRRMENQLRKVFK